MKKFNKQKYAFTLVELIIVITILAILATIAFVSFGNYNKNSRDWNRISTLKNIESGLILYTIKSSIYPDPEKYVKILSWNILLLKQWIVWDEISQKIKLNKEALDPKDKTSYIYTITWDWKKYQLWTYLEENNLVSYISQITKAHANIDYSNRYFYTIWDNIWILLKEINSPITKTDYSTWLNLETNTGSFKIYFSNDVNSGSITSSWTKLIEEIAKNQNITIQESPSTTINWVCWTAHNTPTLNKPTNNLCLTWNPTLVINNTSKYTWNCEWINAGNTITCEAPKQYTITTLIIWTGGTITASTTVNHNSGITLTAIPSANYVIDTWSWDCSWNTTTCILSNITANKTVRVSFKVTCVFGIGNCLGNWYYIITSDWSSNWYDSCAVDISWFDKTKCILKITSVTPNIYVAPTATDSFWYNWNSNQASTCNFLTETCDAIKNLTGTTSNYNDKYALLYCNNLDIWGMNNWYLPPRDEWWLLTIYSNTWKLNFGGGSSWYWSSYFNKWDANNAYWELRNRSTGGLMISMYNMAYRVRCITN